MYNLNEFKGVINTLWEDGNKVYAVLFMVRSFLLGIGSKEGGKYSSSYTLEQALALMVFIGSIFERIFILLHE